MDFSFSDHVGLLEEFLARRLAIVDDIERRLLSVRRKAIAQSGDRALLAHTFSDCFFESTAFPKHLLRLKGHLAAAHLADGFEPAQQDRYSRELDLAELVLRAHHYWEHDRWPGRNGRIVFAQSLYAAFMLRQLEHLSLRIWDPGDDLPDARLRQVQRLLDALNAAGVGPLVRDSRWLIQTAQGPLTKHLKPYFIVAGRISGSLPDDDRMEIHRAGARLAGGHLRSQLRHRSWDTGRPFDDPLVLAMTQSSSSMDIALLVGDLIPLLEAYLAVSQRKDDGARLELADAILQGLSAAPELLLTRLDLLAPSTMIEDLAIERDQDGRARYTWMGEMQLQSVSRYGRLIAETAEFLKQDLLLFDPARTTYSPLGIVYGFCADLLSNMVLGSLRSPASRDLSLEDMFRSRELPEQKLIRAEEWNRLPKGEGERSPFEHSIEWANKMFSRTAGALDARAARPNVPNASNVPQSRFFVVPRGVAADSLPDCALPPGIVPAQEHCLTSDFERARTTGATPFSRSRLSADRAEGRFLASAESNGEWFGVSKVALTACATQEDALLTDVPSPVIDVLRLMCPELLVVL